MTVCPHCAARFSAAPQSERQWLDRHIDRSHGIQRMQLVAEGRQAQSRRPLETAAA